MENNLENFVAGSAQSPVGSRPEDARLGDSRPATPLNSDVSNLLINLNQRLMQLESVGSVVPPSNIGLNVALPERYNGNVGRCRDFLLAVDNVFAIQPHRYSSDEIKTRFIGTLLTHEALAWFRDVLERKPELLRNYGQFVFEFKAFFEDANAQRHAADALGRLKQGKGSCLSYATKFRRLAYETGFNNGALINFFRKGLNEDIKDRLANALEEPEDLEELITLCVKIDQRLYDRRVEKAGNVKYAFTPPRFAPRPQSGVTPMDLDSAQMDKFKKLTPEEKKRRYEQGLCLYCGEKSHKLASCPARNAKMRKGPGLNMLSISSLDSMETISLRSSIRIDDLEVEASAMLDSGATGCFVSEHFVERNFLPTTGLLQESPVRLANGSEVLCEESLSEVSVGIGDAIGAPPVVLDLIVIPGLKFDCVLGLPWLARANPHIDWSTRTLSFKTNTGDSIIKERSSNLKLQSLKFSEYEITSKQEDDVVAGEPLNKERSSNSMLQALNTSDEKIVGLPECLKQFEEVCLEKEIDVLPPIREGIDLEINLKDSSLRPPFLRIYPLSNHEEEELRRWIDKNLASGFIVPSNSPYAAPIFFVKKKNGKLRPCIDYRQLNLNTLKDGHPLPLISDVLSKFKGSTVFSSVDLHGAYNLVRVKPGDEYKASFRCKYGQFEPKVVQFGLTNAPAAFMRFVLAIFRDLLDVYIEIYLDDIIIYSKSLTDHEAHLREVFTRLSNNNLIISLEKCTFFTDELIYLGYKVTTNGIAMEEAKVRAIKEFGVPRNVKEVRGFVGLANYYRKFIKDFSEKVFPLTQLTRKSVEFKWTEVEQEAFEKLKNLMNTSVILKYPDVNSQFYIFCDASDHALGSVLQQRADGEDFRPVEFYSRKFAPAEFNYSVYDKELLAIVESFRVWRHFLLYSPQKVIVKSDHNNLRYFSSSRLWKPRHARWAEELAQFDFTIEHISGMSNVVADALSRSPDKVSLEKEGAEIVLLKDSYFSLAALENEKDTHDWPEDIAMYLVNGEWSCQSHKKSVYQRFISQFKIMGNRLYRLNDSGWASLYLPFGERSKVLERFHDKLGHLAADSIQDLIARRYYWPHLIDDLKAYCKSCRVCQLARSRGGAPRPALQTVPPVAFPFERLGLDFLSNLPLTKSNNRHCITCVDYATRWVWAVPVKTMDAKVVIWFLYHYIITFVGVPSELITDRGRNFVSGEVERFCNQHRIKHLRTSPYHPATNGLIERMHSMLNHGISALCSTRVDRWDEYVDEVVFGIRVRTHAITKFSPFYLLFGVDPRLSGDFRPPNSLLQPLDEVESRIAREGFTNRELEELGVARGQAFMRTQAQRELTTTNTKEFFFKLDDWVKIKNYQKKKFEFSWIGPFIVHGYGYFPTYWLRNPNGELLKSLVNQANMAPWTARLVENEDYFYGTQEESRAEDLIDYEFTLSERAVSNAFPEEEDDVSNLNNLGYGLAALADK